MLDEVREYGLYTIEPPRNLKKEQCRLKFANLIKKDFGGLVRAMTIIARQYIFSGGKDREDFDEENVRERLASWCDGWLNQYIRHTFLAQDLDSLSNRVKDGTLLDLLHGMEPDCEIDRLMAARDDFLNRATDLDKDSKELFGRVSAAISALKELKGKKKYFAKSLFDVGNTGDRGKKDTAQKKNDYHKITYDRIIANALELGRLHRYYLVCRSGILPFDSVRKFTDKNKDGKKLADTDKDLLLKMTAAYLLQQIGFTPGHAPEYVVITLTDISNWMIKKDKPSNFDLDKYKFVNTGEGLFEKKTISSTDKKDVSGIKGNLAKTRIHPEWVKEFYLVDEGEIDNPENRGRIFFSDIEGKMLWETENRRYE